MSGASTMVPCHGRSGESSRWGLPSRREPSGDSCCDHITVGVVAPPMFWSDFHSIHGVPSPSTKTRGSMVPPWSSWQRKGSGRGGERAGGGVGEGTADALGLGRAARHHGREVQDPRRPEPVEVGRPRETRARPGGQHGQGVDRGRPVDEVRARGHGHVVRVAPVPPLVRSTYRPSATVRNGSDSSSPAGDLGARGQGDGHAGWGHGVEQGGAPGGGGAAGGAAAAGGAVGGQGSGARRAGPPGRRPGRRTRRRARRRPRPRPGEPDDPGGGRVSPSPSSPRWCSSTRLPIPTCAVPVGPVPRARPGRDRRPNATADSAVRGAVEADRTWGRTVEISAARWGRTGKCGGKAQDFAPSP